MQARDLVDLSRDELIARAEELGIPKADLLTRAELSDEILRRSVTDPDEGRIVRGLLGLARDLLASVVERGLHLPDAAAKIRNVSVGTPWIAPKAPIATVTLAQIYAAQGHRSRALAVLDELLAREPDHPAARRLRDRIADAPADEPVMPPEPEEPAEWPPTSPSPLAEPAPELVAEPFGMLDDVPLPERYDVDEVVLMPVDPTTVYVYWEVRQATFEQARSVAGEGRLVLRMVAVTASWHGPAIETRDVNVEALVGDCFVSDLPGGAVVRAAVGWRVAAAFEPLSVALEATAPAPGPTWVGAGELSTMVADGVRPADPDDPEALAIAAAVERARRKIAEAASLRGVRGASSWHALAEAPFEAFEPVPPGSSFAN